MGTSKLGLRVVIRRSNNGSNIRCAFVTMTCERSRKYRTPFRNFKRDDTSSRKCECHFKVRGYKLANKNWRFNVICGLHNHDLCEKLVGHPSVCRLIPEEKECVADMILNLVQPKNILATLKWKRSENISNINYVSRYRTCEDEVTVNVIFWIHPDSIKLFNIFSIVRILDSTYHITKNVRSQVKSAAGAKQIESEDGKRMKGGVVKEKIVCAWTDKVRHHGNTTANKIEFAHATLKNRLKNSKGDLCID
ncbi:uncharacterized protein LOC127135989 [Lathyrus oleraceus]|uniref:uncharacterized protein LOC127135989 n=1 Tax=Pisum sativum TaxID=3888 RepID=UPI0021CF4055|nr:uncharacterized protein LOC127135989 [Pisum sativum]